MSGERPPMRMAKWQRDRVKAVGELLVGMSRNPDCSQADVVRFLENLVHEVTGYTLQEFRIQPLCPGCLLKFTSMATMKKHVDPVTQQCRHPEDVWELQLKSRDRWGWSDAAKAEMLAAQEEHGIEPQPWQKYVKGERREGG